MNRITQLMDPTENGPPPSQTASADVVADAVARIVAAYASRPDATPDEIVSLTLRLQGVFGARAAAATPRAAALPPPAPRHGSATPVPALPIDQAVTEDKVFCLCCGRGFTMLKRHLKAEHNLTEEEYRALFALPDDMPLVAPAYSERKAAYAKRVGLGKYQRDAGDDG